MPVVTRITEQKRRKNRRSVFLDGTYAFSCNVNVIARFRLREGMELSAEQIRQIEQGELRQEAFDEAMRYLQSRLHSRKELQTKLERRGHSQDIITDVLEDLQRLGYVDDERYARTRAQASAEYRHHGRRRAYLDLVKAGIAPAVADRALDAVYGAHDSLQAARDLAAKQAPRLARLDPATARRRLAGMLQRRGFDYEDVKTVIDEVVKGEW